MTQWKCVVGLLLHGVLYQICTRESLNLLCFLAPSGGGGGGCGSAGLFSTTTSRTGWSPSCWAAGSCGDELASCSGACLGESAWTDAGLTVNRLFADVSRELTEVGLIENRPQELPGDGMSRELMDLVGLTANLAQDLFFHQPNFSVFILKLFLCNETLHYCHVFNQRGKGFCIQSFSLKKFGEKRKTHKLIFHGNKLKRPQLFGSFVEILLKLKDLILNPTKPKICQKNDRSMIINK